MPALSRVSLLLLYLAAAAQPPLAASARDAWWTFSKHARTLVLAGSSPGTDRQHALITSNNSSGSDTVDPGWPGLPDDPLSRLPKTLQECPKAVAEGQARAFVALSGGRKWSQCPTESHAVYLHSLALPAATHIIDVGSNKGYSAATYFDLWSPELGFSPPALYAFYKAQRATGGITDVRQLCGACNDCKAQPGAAKSRTAAAAPRRASASAVGAVRLARGAAASIVRAAAGGAAKPARPADGAATLHVHSFEASEPNYRLSRLAAQHYFPPAGPAVAQRPARSDGSGGGSDGGGDSQWHLTWAAVGDREGTVPWPKGCSNEKCSQATPADRAAAAGDAGEDAGGDVGGGAGGDAGRNAGDDAGRDAGGAGGGGGTGGTSDVTLTTVDAIMRHRNLSHVDFLKVDTEGYDANVLRGAAGALGAQRIGMLIFEYHRIGLWRDAVTLRSVVDALGGYGYVCYMTGRPTLSRMTRCWSDLYERKAWSNVLCATERHLAYLEGQSFVGSLELP